MLIISTIVFQRHNLSLWQYILRMGILTVDTNTHLETLPSRLTGDIGILDSPLCYPDLSYLIPQTRFHRRLYFTDRSRTSRKPRALVLPGFRQDNLLIHCFSSLVVAKHSLYRRPLPSSFPHYSILDSLISLGRYREMPAISRKA